MEVAEANHERIVNLKKLQKRMEELHPLVHETLFKNLHSNRKSNSKGALPNFTESYWVVVAHDDFTAGEKLRVRWRASRIIVKALSDYVFQVKDIRTGDYDYIHRSRLKF